MKGLVHKVRIPIYNEVLYVAFDKELAFRFFGFTEKQKKENEFCDGFAFEGENHKGHRALAMYIEKVDGRINVATTAHECFHIADLLLEIKGMEYKPESGNEHMAYLIGYLVDKVFDCLVLDEKYS